ncbi:MAG: glucose-1-phosphate adenylyltransferase subunit GlgD [Atopostipes suicloacalis]|nr:glucose-1-phosphate adenylyltransferase subunit GlgD [Atopostipes suicloacalis]MDN6730619.1 glucose-1-phosphate adenylyltransferase subunit GlgD [Atopostipes suicloacalis]
MRNRFAVLFNLVEEKNELMPLTKRRPVATLPIAGRYRLVDFPFSSLTNAEIQSAALFISGTGRSLYDHVRAGQVWGLDNVTGGGIFTHSHIEKKDDTHTYYQDHRDYLEKSHAKYVVLLGSNILANLSIDSMLDFHLEEENDLTVAYKIIPRNNLRKDTIFSRYIFSKKEEKRIERIQALSDLALVATEVMFGLNILIAEKETFMTYLDKVEEVEELVSVENILNAAKENSATKVGGYEYTGYLKAIEDISSYFEANMDMLDEEKFNALFYRDFPVLTKSKNSPPTYYGKESDVQNAILANDCEVYGEVKNSVIFRKSFICRKAIIKNSIILQGSYIDEEANLNYVILDKRVRVEKGVKLEGTAENPIVVPKDSKVLFSGEIVKG